MPAKNGIALALSRDQIDLILGQAGEGGALTVLLTGLTADTQVLDRAYREITEGGGNLSSSLLSGLLVLAAFPHDGTSIGNATIARRLGMNSSTAHRYVTTLVVAGLVEKDPDKRKYRLAR